MENISPIKQVQPDSIKKLRERPTLKLPTSLTQFVDFDAKPSRGNFFKQ
jgi:hypothetical protein